MQLWHCKWCGNKVRYIGSATRKDGSYPVHYYECERCWKRSGYASGEQAKITQMMVRRAIALDITV